MRISKKTKIKIICRYSIELCFILWCYSLTGYHGHHRHHEHDHGSGHNGYPPDKGKAHAAGSAASGDAGAAAGSGHAQNVAQAAGQGIGHGVGQGISHDLGHETAHGLAHELTGLRELSNDSKVQAIMDTRTEKVSMDTVSMDTVSMDTVTRDATSIMDSEISGRIFIVSMSSVEVLLLISFV